jgi:hypothetical protein
MNVDYSNSKVAKEVKGLDPNVDHTKSIMQFFTLSTIIQCNNLRNANPIMNLVKSKILTFDQHVTAVSHVKQTKEDVLKEKEHRKIKKQ